MYLNYKIKIPTDSPGVTSKKIKGITYIYYAYEHSYSAEKKYTVQRVQPLASVQRMLPG